MANGTIAFDTLQTSGQISGTAKSVDTDYVAHGTFKATITFNGTGTVAIRKSFNIASLVDNYSGNYSINSTNGMDSSEYLVSAVCGNYDAANPGPKTHTANPNSSTDSSVETMDSSNAANSDVAYVGIGYVGDLA